MFISIHAAGRQEGHGLHRKRVGGHARDLIGDRGVFADRRAPLNAFGRPPTSNLEAALAQAGARRGQCQPASVQRRQRDAQPLALGQQDVLARDADVGKAHHRIVKRSQSHETAPMRHFDPRPISLDDERRDLILGFSAAHLGRRFGHDDHDPRFGPIRAPKFFSVEDESFSIGRRLSAGLHRRGIRTDRRFGESKSRNLTFGDSRQVFAFLLLGAEQDQRLRHPNRLVGRN